MGKYDGICPMCGKNKKMKRKAGSRAGKYQGYCKSCMGVRRRKRYSDPVNRERKREIERNSYQRRTPGAVPMRFKGKTEDDIYVREVLYAFCELIDRGFVTGYGLEVLW